MKEIKITKNEENQRLDKYLLKYFNKAPKSFVYKMLRNKTTNEVAGVLKTDQNGQAESEELLIGSYNEKGIKELFQYEVVETKAPEGYQLDSTPHPVTFDLEGEKDGEILVELDVTNQRIPTDAPKTGDDTVSPMLLLGICAVCAGILIGCFVYRKKKQETDEKEEN